MRNHTRISRPSELEELDSWRLMPPAERPQLQLKVAGTATEKIRLWERDLTRLQSPCGCEQGAGGLVVGIAGYLVYLLLRSGGWGHPGWREFWIGCGVVAATTSIGKVLGMALGRRKLRQLIRQIRAEWKPPTPPEHSYEVGASIAPRASRSCCGN